MSSIWGWFTAREQEYREAGDGELVRMASLHGEAFRHQESDPDQAFALYTEGRRLAERLGEPWWVFLYEVWRVIALSSYKGDFNSVLDPAVHCAVKAHQAEYAQHPWRFAAVNNLVEVYTAIDPRGYADDIQKSLAHLEASFDDLYQSDRYVMLEKKCDFLRETGDFSGALDTCWKRFGMVENDPSPWSAEWFAMYTYADLCWLMYRLGRWDILGDCAREAENVARDQELGGTILAQALMWQAVVARRDGRAADAGRLHAQAVSRIGRNRNMPWKYYFDALTAYHLFGGDLPGALAVRAQEFERIKDTGQLVYECQCQINRCLLLSWLGRLEEADLETARAYARRLRKPDAYLEEIENVAAGE